MNIYKLLEVLEEKNIKRSQLAKVLGVSETTLRTRFKKKTCFTLDEVYLIKDFLELSKEEMIDIFFKS